MSPVWIFSGARDAAVARRQAERRLGLDALAAAVREHERALRRQDGRLRPEDVRLYRRLRQITAGRDSRHERGAA